MLIAVQGLDTPQTKEATTESVIIERVEGDAAASLWPLDNTVSILPDHIHTPTVVPEPQPTPLPRVQEVPQNDALSDWLAGYRAFDGPAEWEDDFTTRVIVCESGWSIEPGNPSYIGPMQWSPDSWARVSGYTGLTDRYSWYAHGGNTAVWVTDLGVDPSSTGGWYHTWNYGCKASNP